MRRLTTPWLTLALTAALSAACAHAQRLDIVSPDALLAQAGASAFPRQSVQEARTTHVRPLDASSRAFLEEGLRHSVTFRALVQAIDASDVLVLVQTLTRATARPSAGTTFVSHTGRNRVLSISLLVGQDWPVAVVLLGHELQHVVEVVHSPEVVDLRGYGRLFRAIGSRSPCPTRATACFETDAAVAVGQHVGRDLSRRMPSADGVVALQP
jgi:hypothetical protein